MGEPGTPIAGSVFVDTPNLVEILLWETFENPDRFSDSETHFLMN